MECVAHYAGRMYYTSVVFFIGALLALPSSTNGYVITRSEEHPTLNTTEYLTSITVYDTARCHSATLRAHHV